MSDARPGRFEPQIRMVGGRRMQCRDVPDQAFLDALRRAPGVGGRPAGCRMRWAVQAELERVVGWLPERLFLAKARGLIRRGLLSGCPCGCRGDYELPGWQADGGELVSDGIAQAISTELHRLLIGDREPEFTGLSGLLDTEAAGAEPQTAAFDASAQLRATLERLYALRWDLTPPACPGPSCLLHGTEHQHTGRRR